MYRGQPPYGPLIIFYDLYSFTSLEGTKSIILNDPPCKDGNFRFTTLNLEENVVI